MMGSSWICNAMCSLAMLASDVRILEREKLEAMCSLTADDCSQHLTCACMGRRSCFTCATLRTVAHWAEIIAKSTD